MAYNQQLADRIRIFLQNLENIEEKEMMGGLAFLYNNKMCVGVIKDEMMCRIDPRLHDEVVEKNGCRTMDFTKRPMKGYIFVDETGMRNQKEFEYWIDLAISFNKFAKASKKKKNK